jgi:membrane-bound metal-dependent hydrolase YbcI (DUF457 family)
MLGAAAGAVAGAAVEAHFGTRIFMVATGAFGGLLSDADTHSSILGKLLPKWWHKLTPGHRRFTHSIPYTALVFAIALGVQYLGVHFFSIWKEPGLPFGPIALTAGVGSHLFADILTELGVPLFYPFYKKHIRLPKKLRMTTGEKTEDKAVQTLLVLTVAFLLIPVGQFLLGNFISTPQLFGLHTEPVLYFGLFAIIIWLAYALYTKRKKTTPKKPKRKMHKK